MLNKEKRIIIKILCLIDKIIRNSLILFGVNIKELDKDSWKSLTLCLDSYIILRKLMKVFHPKFMKIKKPSGSGILEKKLQHSLGKGVPK